MPHEFYGNFDIKETNLHLILCHTEIKTKIKKLTLSLILHHGNV